jgi:hypothetical protein
MSRLLDQISNAQRGDRLLSGSVGLGTAAVLGFSAASHFGLRDELKGADVSAGVMAGLGAVWLGYGIYTLLTPWAGERLYLDYRAALNKGDYAAAFALANDRLRDIAASEARGRWITGIGAGVLVAISAVVAGTVGLHAESATMRLTARSVGAVGVLGGFTMFAGLLFVESPIERLATIWQRDAGRLQLQPQLQPLPGGAAIGISGRL